MTEQIDALGSLPDYTITRRARDVWKKFMDWYGADTIVKQFGAIPSREWCEAIDGIRSRDEMSRILGGVRAGHVTFPPRLPEFEAIVAKCCKRLVESDGPTMQERLTEYVLRTKTLSKVQLARPWLFLYARSPEGRIVTGVVVPADGDWSGHRVMSTDLVLDDSPIHAPEQWQPLELPKDIVKGFP